MSGTKGTIITSCTMTSSVFFDDMYDSFRDWGGVGRKNGEEDQIRKLQLSMCVTLFVHRFFGLHFFLALKPAVFSG